jgi:hypothetical protein
VISLPALPMAKYNRLGTKLSLPSQVIVGILSSIFFTPKTASLQFGMSLLKEIDHWGYLLINPKQNNPFGKWIQAFGQWDKSMLRSGNKYPGIIDFRNYKYSFQ